MNSTFFASNKITNTLSFNTTDSTPSFSIVKSPGNGVWNFNNEKIFTGNSQSYSFTGAGPIYNIKLHSDSFDKITSINFSNLSISGSVDLSLLKKVNDFTINSNPTLTALTIPNSSANVNFFYAYSCDLRRLNLSGLTNLGTDFKVHSNPKLTGLTLPNTSRPFSNFHAYSCKFINLNLSGLSNLGGSFDVSDNGSLISLNLPNSSQPFSNFYAYSCGLTSLNLSGLTGLGGYFNINDNKPLTSLTLPISNKKFISFSANGCNLSAINFYPISGSQSDNISILIKSNRFDKTNVNQILYDLNAIGWTGGTLDISANSAPDSTSGPDGLAALSSLTGSPKNWTIVHD